MLVAAIVAQLGDMLTFALMIATHGSDAELNGLARDLLIAAPIFAIGPKAAGLAGVTLLWPAMAAAGPRGRWTRRAFRVGLAFLTVAGVIGLISNVAVLVG